MNEYTANPALCAAADPVGKAEEVRFKSHVLTQTVTASDGLLVHFLLLPSVAFEWSSCKEATVDALPRLPPWLSPSWNSSGEQFVLVRTGKKKVWKQLAGGGVTSGQLNLATVLKVQQAPKHYEIENLHCITNAFSLPHHLCQRWSFERQHYPLLTVQRVLTFFFLPSVWGEGRIFIHERQHLCIS